MSVRVWVRFVFFFKHVEYLLCTVPLFFDVTFWLSTWRARALNPSPYWLLLDMIPTCYKKLQIKKKSVVCSPRIQAFAYVGSLVWSVTGFFCSSDRNMCQTIYTDGRCMCRKLIIGKCLGFFPSTYIDSWYPRKSCGDR